MYCWKRLNMIDPYKRCPRCDVEYISGDRNIYTYYHIVWADENGLDINNLNYCYTKGTR